MNWPPPREPISWYNHIDNLDFWRERTKTAEETPVPLAPELTYTGDSGPEFVIQNVQ